jgi:SAM-dependent methyltransferase
MNGIEAASKISLLLNKGDKILDIGSGKGEQAQFFRDRDFLITTLDFNKEADITCKFENYYSVDVFDCVWASHVLEHQLNVHDFLTKCRTIIREYGYLAITVPPLKHNIVGGHVSLWNAGLLLYNLVLAGFDCSNAKVLTYGYNISVIVRRPPWAITREIFTLPLFYDEGDIELIAPYMPEGCKNQSFNGDIKRLNWDDN